MPHGIALRRRTTLSAELETMWNRLVEITAEIAEAEPDSTTYQAASRAADNIAALRWMLEREQRAKIEEIRQRLREVRR